MAQKRHGVLNRVDLKKFDDTLKIALKEYLGLFIYYLKGWV
jgi:hypothetical protein